MTLSVALRRGTRVAHETLEQADFFRGLEAGTVALERFVGYLRAMAAVHYAMDRELARTECRALAATTRESWLPALCHDIHALGRGGPAFAVPAALAMTNDVRQRAAQVPHSLIGFRYVFEGSVMGMPHLRARVAACFDFDDCRHLHYLNIGGPAAAERWKAFRNLLDGLELESEQRAEVVAGARAAFHHVSAIADDLTWTGDPPRLRADAINPAAGVHPIAADPLVIEAAIVAGDRAWDRWPYCRERYVDRGLAFTRSDSAWLAMLVDLPAPHASRQLDWLANVLAARGMPSLILEDHLILVHDALVEAIPPEAARFALLLDAAAELRAHRTAGLPESIAAQLEHDYQQRANDPLDLGKLGVEAVRDECFGRRRAVDSFLDWATEERVGACRATALRTIVAEARAFAAREATAPAS